MNNITKKIEEQIFSDIKNKGYIFNGNIEVKLDTLPVIVGDVMSPSESFFSMFREILEKRGKQYELMINIENDTVKYQDCITYKDDAFISEFGSVVVDGERRIILACGIFNVKRALTPYIKKDSKLSFSANTVFIQQAIYANVPNTNFRHRLSLPKKLLIYIDENGKINERLAYVPKEVFESITNDDLLFVYAYAKKKS